MSENVPPLELDQHHADHRAEYEREGQAIFQMIQRGDFIKAGWWHWRCRRESCAGDVAYGYVQADTMGQIVVPETFEQDHIRPRSQTAPHPLNSDCHEVATPREIRPQPSTCFAKVVAEYL